MNTRRAPKSFPARFPGKCIDTGRTINVGDRIERSPGGGWRLSAPPGTARPSGRGAPAPGEGFDAWQSRSEADRARIEAEEDAREARKSAMWGEDEHEAASADRQADADFDAYLCRVNGEGEAKFAARLARAERDVYGDDPRQPPPGSWAEVARFMAKGDDSGFDWDAWKDEMKEGGGL